jgi:hypothetical protein
MKVIEKVPVSYSVVARTSQAEVWRALKLSASLGDLEEP